MTCQDPCDNCNRKGLPILFTRYAAAYSAQDKGMAALKHLQPTGQLQAQPGGVALEAALYNVRMLRAGYLYLLIEIAGEKRWEGYAVHPHGYLTAFPVSLPEAVQVHMACARDDRQANASMVWVRDAKRVQKLWYMFHPDPLDYEHMKKEIEPNSDKYMQSFDVAGWVGGSTSQKDTCQPDQLHLQVVEYSALMSADVCDAVEPQMYGLMGSNALERGWGDYEQEIQDTRWTVDILGNPTVEKFSRTVKRIGPTYDAAHGVRLQKMAEFLHVHKGAVVACQDATGISQELGHLQAEVQTHYVRWQLSSAPGFAFGVTNEWVYQSAIGAQGLRDLIQRGAVARTNDRIARWNKLLDKRESDPVPGISQTAKGARAVARANQQRELAEAQRHGDTQFAQLFDNVAAANIIDAQRTTYEKLTTLLAYLGKDQVAWLRAKHLETAAACYSPRDDRIDRVGGGFMLSLQLAQCLSGIETNSVGCEYLKGQDLWGDGLLAQMLCFHSVTQQLMLKDMYGNVASSAPASLPDTEPGTGWVDNLVDRVLKPWAGRFALGDKALAFGEAVPTIAESGKLRKLAWPLHVFSLMSVKMMQTVNGLPASRVEAAVVRFAALTGVTTMGKTAATYAESLSRADHERLRIAERKLGEAARKTAADHSLRAAPKARAAALAGIFDLVGSVMKGYQFNVKRDGRTAAEMVGSLLQGTGSIMDWRAKVYEETIFKGVKGADIFTAKGMATTTDNLNALKLKSMRLTAFKFLLPAAIVSVYWDSMDALISYKRGTDGLIAAQVASLVGAVFTTTGTGMVASGALLGISASVWATAAATLGLIGAVLTLGAVIAFLILKEEDWLTWLRDNPLNKERRGQKPVHRDLQDTLQKLANAQTSV